MHILLCHSIKLKTLNTFFCVFDWSTSLFPSAYSNMQNPQLDSELPQSTATYFPHPHVKYRFSSHFLQAQNKQKLQQI